MLLQFAVATNSWTDETDLKLNDNVSKRFQPPSEAREEAPRCNKYK